MNYNGVAVVNFNRTSRVINGLINVPNHNRKGYHAFFIAHLPLFPMGAGRGEKSEVGCGSHLHAVSARVS
jgi:hypothetical protein